MLPERFSICFFVYFENAKKVFISVTFYELFYDLYNTFDFSIEFKEKITPFLAFDF